MQKVKKVKGFKQRTAGKVAFESEFIKINGRAATRVRKWGVGLFQYVGSDEVVYIPLEQRVPLLQTACITDVRVYRGLRKYGLFAKHSLSLSQPIWLN